MRDAVTLLRFREYLFDERLVVAMLAGILQRGAYLAVVDKLGGVFRFYVIFCHLA